MSQAEADPAPFRVDGRRTDTRQKIHEVALEVFRERGYDRAWGVGRHVIGSNYFCYVQDPWGSFAEYSHGIDFVPADIEWAAADHPLEDSFYVWGPPPPEDFVVNHELAPPST